MNELTLRPIGHIHAQNETFLAQIDADCRPALAGLEGFSHVQLFWWFDGCDTPECRGTLTEESPYRRGPDALGVFATRSPRRPNPIALSCAQVLDLRPEEGLLVLDFVDANDGSPLLDLKPYTPSLDRVESPALPAWCAHWPMSREASGAFDWGGEFNF